MSSFIPFTHSLAFSGHYLLLSILLAVWGLTSANSTLAQSLKPPAKPVSVTSPSRSVVTKPLLKSGSQGEAVTELQGMLKLLGFFTGTVDGVFDESTVAAVTKFQKAANLTADGVVGTDTWERLLPPSPSIADTAKPASAQPSPTDSFPAPGTTKPTPAATAATTKPSKPTETVATGDRSSSTTQDATLPILRLGMKGTAVEGLQQRLRALGFLKGSVDGVFGAETQSAVKAAQRNFNLEPDGIVGSATWMGLLR